MREQEQETKIKFFKNQAVSKIAIKRALINYSSIMLVVKA